MAEAYTATDKRRAVRRELAFRRRVYPRHVENGKMTQQDADREIAIMESIAADYDRLVGLEQDRVPQRSLDLDPIDIGGPAPLKLMKEIILARVVEAQAAGDIPLRHMPPDDESAVIWIGPAEDPHAFATFFETYPKVAWLDVIYVRPEYRHRGYGALLLQAFEQCLRASSFKKGELGTELDNLSMQRVAMRCGWAKSHLMMELTL